MVNKVGKIQKKNAEIGGRSFVLGFVITPPMSEFHNADVSPTLQQIGFTVDDKFLMRFPKSVVVI